MRIVYLLPIIGAIAAMLVIVLILGGARTAPQEAAGYAMACAFAVVPYVFARAVISMYEDAPKINTDRIVAAIVSGNAHKPAEKVPSSDQ